MTFHVGQRVVCVATGGDWWGSDDGFQYDGPRMKDLLTIATIYTDEDGTFLGFAEWPDDLNDEGFHSDNFRPTTSRKTDISIFKAMLNPSHTPEKESV